MSTVHTKVGSSTPEQQVLSTLNRDGTRRWIKPKPSRGKFWHRRRAVAYVLIALFTLLPYIKIGGKPAMLLDVAHREFTFFGFTFLPTDTLLLALFLIGVVVTIFLLTAIFGRVWCGWACPQTVYMEFLYRPIERLFDGEPGKKSPDSYLAVRKFGKYAAFFVVSMFLAHTFLAYFVGVDQLVQWVRRSPVEHPSSFIIMAVVTGLMMFDFAFFREQTCIVACPYGRFQSVLLDKKSLIVGYDYKRGEPRGKKKRTEAAVLPLPVVTPDGLAVNSKAQGDCIDCHLCVTTCPTGIDIRKGLQMECVHCTQCMDACDAVMEKIGRPLGLIRYCSQSDLEGEPTKKFRLRLVWYPAILLVVASAFVYTLATKGTADVMVSRGAGLPFNVMPDGLVTNQLKFKVTNRRKDAASYTISLVDVPKAEIRADENPIRLMPGRRRIETILVVFPREILHDGKRDVVIRVSDGETFQQDMPYRLLGPNTLATGPESKEPPKAHSDSEHREHGHGAKEKGD
jgi:cytochrome c oxidase accessory protein FixG